MKKIKSLLLAGIITASCFAGTISTSAATTDDTAYIYVTDVNSEHISDYPVAETPSAPALTAKVGDIIEVTVNAKATTEIKDFTAFWLMTYFGQEKPGDHERIEDNPLAYTDKYYDGGVVAQLAPFDNTMIITAPDPTELSPYYSHFGYTLTCPFTAPYNFCDLSDTVALYKFTLEVKKGGKMFINTTNHEAVYWDENYEPVDYEPVDDADLIDVKTSVAVVGNVNKTAIKGDVDGNGVLTVSDATLIQKYRAGITDFTPEQKKLGDVNGDGAVNVLDATAVQRSILNP